MIDKKVAILFGKILLATVIAGIWRELDGGADSVAFIIFIFMLSVLLINPIKFQPPEKREEFIEKMRQKKAQKEMLIQKQKDERARIRKEKQERENAAQKELQDRIKK